MAKKLTPEQRAARLEAHQEAAAAREARRVAAGRRNTGEVLLRLQGSPAIPRSTAPTPSVDWENGAGPGGIVLAQRAAARESVHGARERVREAARRQEAEHRSALARVSKMTPEQRTELLNDLRAGCRPDWLPPTNPIYNQE